MARKKRNPAAAATATGAQGNEVFSDIANLAHPMSQADWLAIVEAAIGGASS
jgi:hypothetical protein